jgi:Cof subfamily protein (haloacid dehalogenase superfamily)
MRNKAILIDLDGVVVDYPTQKLPSKKLVQATISLKDKYYICAATGRVWSFAKPILKALKLTDPCIISAGTQICDPAPGKILWQKAINKKALSGVIKLLKQYPQYRLLVNDITEEDYLIHGGISINDFSPKEPIYVLNQIFVPNAKANKIHQKLNRIKGIACVIATSAKPGNKDLHIVNQQATKEQAVAQLLKIIKVKKENTIAIGDGPNDIHLFNAVGCKVAMANAVKELKQTADKIIGSVKEDGLADYFQKLT